MLGIKPQYLSTPAHNLQHDSNDVNICQILFWQSVPKTASLPDFLLIRILIVMIFLAPNSKCT